MNTPHPPTAVTTHPTTPTKPEPPCAARPDDWDLDIGAPDTWHDAIRTCQDCPILAECRQLVATLTTSGMPPRSMIWAGVGYDGSGNAVANLDRHRTRPIEHKQPLRIVRTGPTFTRTGVEHTPDDSFPTNPRRTIVLRRRPLPLTGTANR